MRTLVTAFLLFIPAVVSTQPGSNPELERDVQHALAMAGFDPGALTVSTRGRTVVLHGTVRSAREKLLAIETAFSVSAVQEVETALELEVSVTPEVEEEIWFVVLQEGLGDGIDGILVEDGIARVKAPTIDDARRERLKRVLEGVSRVSSVTFDSAPVVATAPSSSPEPPPQSETGIEVAVTAPVEPPPANETMSSEGEVVESGESREEPIETSSETPTPPTAEPEASESDIAEIGLPAPEPEPVIHEPEPEPKVPEPEVPEPEVPEPEVAESDVPEPAVPQPVPSPPISSSPSPAAPSGTNLTATSDIERVGKDIVGQILTYPDYTVFDHIQLGMEAGVIKLIGFVTAAAKKEEIEARCARVAGDLRIENELRVLLDSSSDDTLRKRLFERIYGNPTFVAFADSENPPVHIIVESGGVILTGVVDRQIDASVAETIARNTFGVRRVENRLRVTTSIVSP